MTGDAVVPVPAVFGRAQEPSCRITMALESYRPAGGGLGLGVL